MLALAVVHRLLTLNLLLQLYKTNSLEIMNFNRVILYYNFLPIADPEAVKLWQKTLCESLNLKGRILISSQGINGTLGGHMDDIKKYIKNTREYPGFKKLISNGLREQAMISRS